MTITVKVIWKCDVCGNLAKGNDPTCMPGDWQRVLGPIGTSKSYDRCLSCVKWDMWRAE